jgi:prevent-host-death family protein
MTEEVGIRELRQNLSRHLDRVREGEHLIVTDRNRPVAVLGPVPRNDSTLERLITEGRATRPVGSVADLGPPLDIPGAMTLSAALDEVRGER